MLSVSIGLLIVGAITSSDGPESTQPPSSTTDGESTSWKDEITNAWIVGHPHDWDADPEDDGIRIWVELLDNTEEMIRYESAEIPATIEIYATESRAYPLQPSRLLYSGSSTLQDWHEDAFVSGATGVLDIGWDEVAATSSPEREDIGILQVAVLVDDTSYRARYEAVPIAPAGQDMSEATVPEDEDETSEDVSAHLVTTSASDLVLSVEDFEPGWVRKSARPTDKEGAQSAYHVYFYQGTVYPTVVQNTVAVYPSIEKAHSVYLDQKPKNISLEKPGIGDESFLDISKQPTQSHLMFRKANVVVWLWLQQGFGDLKPYAEIIADKL